MEFTKLIGERYSCKKYDGKQISREELTAILEAGRLAPTAKNQQPWHVYVAQSREALEKIDKVTPCRYNAPTVLIFACDTERVFTFPGGSNTSADEDCSIVATHMMLAAKNAGVDSCWLNFFDPAQVKEVFSLPEKEKVVLLMDLGYAAPEGKPLPNHTSFRPAEETISYL